MRLLFLVLLAQLTACSGAGAQSGGNDSGADFQPDSRPMGKTLVYECTELEFIARVGPGEMALWLEDRYLILSQVRSASGSKYQEGDTVFWSHGDEMTLELGSRRYSDCTLNPLRAPWEDARRRGVDFRAVGNEPGWHLELKKGQSLLFVGDYGARRLLFPAPEQSMDGTTTKYHSMSDTDEISISVSETPCTDTMKGNQYPATAEVQLNGKFYQGCGMALEYPWQ